MRHARLTPPLPIGLLTLAVILLACRGGLVPAARCPQLLLTPLLSGASRPCGSRCGAGLWRSSRTHRDCRGTRRGICASSMISTAATLTETCLSSIRRSGAGTHIVLFQVSGQVEGPLWKVVHEH